MGQSSDLGLNTRTNQPTPGKTRRHVHRELKTELGAFRSTRLTPILSPPYRWGGRGPEGKGEPG